MNDYDKFVYVQFYVNTPSSYHFTLILSYSGLGSSVEGWTHGPLDCMHFVMVY